jgi:heptosyltransferase-2
MDAETVPHGAVSGNGQSHLSGVRRVVIVAPNWLGDAVMALPAIEDVRRALPDAAIVAAARPSVAPMFSLVPAVAETIALRDRSGWRELSAGRFDAALLLPNSFNAAFTAWRAGVPERWGYRADWRAPLLTRRVDRPTGVHQAAYYQHLVRALGCPSGPLVPRLEVSATLRATAAMQLAAAGWDQTAPLVALAPGAAYGGAKRWPAESFGRLAGRLAIDASTIVLIGSRADARAGDEVLSHVPDRTPVVNMMGRTSLPELAGVLAVCRTLVTNDSGAMHLAAAIGTRVVAMFGPTRERETHPLGGRSVVLTHDVWCRPCMLRECPLDHQCMRGITVDAVAAAVETRA